MRHPARAPAALLAVAAALALAGCGAAGADARPGTPAPSGSTPGRAYASCLVSHLDASGGAGARRGCRKLKPAGGIGPLLLELSSCQPAHGVALPSASPGTGAGDALRYLGTIADGSPAQQSAFRSCESGL
ncbi:MAG TPA: hypothetical protein VFX25_06130 [Streptosporangiaceae bacterium]|nr:hypothetical protein [Streptosporangiaceae bacterium]